MTQRIAATWELTTSQTWSHLYNLQTAQQVGVCFRQLNTSESASQQFLQLIYLGRRGPSVSGGFQGLPEPFELNGMFHILLEHPMFLGKMGYWIIGNSLKATSWSFLSPGEMILDPEVGKRPLEHANDNPVKLGDVTFAMRIPRVTVTDLQPCLTLYSGDPNSSFHAWVVSTSPSEPFPLYSPGWRISEFKAGIKSPHRSQLVCHSPFPYPLQAGAWLSMVQPRAITTLGSKKKYIQRVEICIKSKLE